MRKIFSNISQTLSGNGLRPQLIRSGLGSAGIQALNRLVGLALVIVLARSLGAEGYGIYAYALAIMSLLMVVAEAGLPTLLMRELAASYGLKDWGLLHDTLRRVLRFVALAAAIVSTLGLLVLWWWWGAFSLAMLYTMGWMLLALPVFVLCKTISFALHGLNRIVIGQAIDMLIRPLLILVIISIFFFVWPGLREPYYAMLAQLMGAVSVLIIGALLLKRYLPMDATVVEQEHRSHDRFKSALHFILIGGAGAMNSYSDIIMLSWFATVEDVGIYRVAVQGATLVAFGLTAVNSVVAPQFSKLYAQGDIVRLQFLATQSARVILLSALPLALAFILAGGAIASWMFGTEYSAARTALGILAAGQLVNAGFGSVGLLLNMTGHERVTARIFWRTALLNIVLNAVMIPHYGLEGAAFATTLSLVIWNALLHREVKKRLGIISTAFRISMT
jgi:O-antigen/teichoic acid export membrane protein